MKYRRATSLPNTLRIAITLLLLLANNLSNAQILGLEPPATNWRIIKTPYAEVIYESQSEQKAQRVANLVDYLAERDSSFIGGPAQYVPIILHSQSTFPAGVPNLAPWRSDWSLAAPQDPFMGAMPWVDGLTVHEYRHHQQMTRAKHGWFEDFLRVVLGQTGWYIGVLTIQPNWFFEGDATYTETVLTNGGRGRMPKFDREYRTLRLSGLDYNYEKASRYSRKDFVPNIYRQGYYLTSYARKEFGTDIWTRVLEDTYKKKGIFYPFSRSLKNLTGYRTKDLYRAAMRDLDSMWITQDKNLTLTESRLISSKPKKVFTDYKYPYYTVDGKILVQKSSFKELRTFYLIDQSGAEKRLFQPGNVTSDHVNLALRENSMTWAENRFHPRWDLKDYSVIFKYDMSTGKKKQLTRKTRYYSPSISSDGNTIAVLKILENGNQVLAIIDGNTGEEMKEYANPERGQYSYPRITRDDRSIITGYTDSRGNTLRMINIETGEIRDLLEFSDYVATRPYDHDGWIYFSGTHTGINNIYAISLDDGEVFQITSSRFGAYMPNVSQDGQKLVFGEYTALGFEIREMDLNQSEWQSYDLSTPSMLNYYQSLAEEEGGNVLDRVPQTTYSSEKFNSLTKGLLKFHTWTPSLDQNEYGLEVVSNNIMSNTAATVGYRYNFKESTSVTYGKISYGALYPIIDLGYSYNVRNSKRIYDDQYEYTEYDWRESELQAGFRIPFRLSSGTYSTNLALKAQYSHFFLSDDTVTDEVSQNDSFGAAVAGLQFSRVQSRAARQLWPRWGQIFTADYNRSLEDQNQAMSLDIYGDLYFPGFHKTHSILFSGAYREENLVNVYRFENQFKNPRGFLERYYSDTVNTDFEEFRIASFNYLMPIAFPDIDLGSIAYFQSISANMYYEYAVGRLNGEDTFMRAAGLDIGFEFTSLRLFRTSLILRGLYRFDQPDTSMNPFLFDVVFEIVDLAF